MSQMMDTQDILDALKHNYARVINLVELQNRPLLAHYTSLDAVEKIIMSEQFWFSNPLFMNDVQEVRFGLVEGQRLFIEGFNEPAFVAANDKAVINELIRQFLWYYNKFEEEHVLNTFVFCLSEHDPADNDGRLSMWRGYGGNGSGAALVFNTDFATMRDDSPLLIGKVVYATDDERRAWLKDLVDQAKALIASQTIPPSLLHLLAFTVLQVMKVYALGMKHKAFEEEREWRIIYMPDRDPNNLLSGGYSHIVGKNGVEPKLHMPIKPLPFETPASWKFESILDRIILGPSISTYLAQSAVKKMLIDRNKRGFASKVVASSIPFRSS